MPKISTQSIYRKIDNRERRLSEKQEQEAAKKILIQLREIRDEIKSNVRKVEIEYRLTYGINNGCEISRNDPKNKDLYDAFDTAQKNYTNYMTAYASHYYPSKKQKKENELIEKRSKITTNPLFGKGDTLFTFICGSIHPIVIKNLHYDMNKFIWIYNDTIPETDLYLSREEAEEKKIKDAFFKEFSKIL